MITVFKNFVLDILFPSQCLHCQTDTSSSPPEEKLVCFSCLEKIPINSSFFCPACHNRSPEGKTCLSCRGKSPINRLLLASDYEHEILKKIILAYKYGCKKDLCRPLYSILLKYFDHLDFSPEKNTAIIAVPLHKDRERARGFNQSELIARLFSNNFKLDILDDVLIRKINTPPQADFPHPKERLKNIAGAFECLDSQALKDKKIILIDDVVTTGATIRECARTLRKAGAKEIWALAIARG